MLLRWGPEAVSPLQAKYFHSGPGVSLSGGGGYKRGLTNVIYPNVRRDISLRMLA